MKYFTAAVALSGIVAIAPMASAELSNSEVDYILSAAGVKEFLKYEGKFAELPTSDLLNYIGEDGIASEWQKDTLKGSKSALVLDIGSCGPAAEMFGGTSATDETPESGAVKINEISVFVQAKAIERAFVAANIRVDSHGLPFDFQDFLVASIDEFLPAFDSDRVQSLNDRLLKLYESGALKYPHFILATGGCGAGEVDVSVLTDPPATSVAFISDFNFGLCEIDSAVSNAWDPMSCRYWSSYSGTTSGRRLFRAELPNGEDICGSVRVTNPEEIRFDLGDTKCPK